MERANTTSNQISYISNEFGLYTTQTLGMRFYTGGSNLRMAIDNAGNVGIGTEIPGTVLQIVNPANASASGQETLRLSSSAAGLTAGSGPYLSFTTTANTEIGRIYSIAEGIASTHGLAFYTFGGAISERLRISGTGNVGIGTTTPQAGFVVTDGNVEIGTWTASTFKMEMRATNAGTGLQVSGGTNALFRVGTVANTSFLDIEPDNTGVSIEANDIDNLRLTPAGNVGMDPTLSQDVYGP